jgi:hypothetical protein
MSIKVFLRNRIVIPARYEEVQIAYTTPVDEFIDSVDVTNIDNFNEGLKVSITVRLLKEIKSGSYYRNLDGGKNIVHVYAFGDAEGNLLFELDASDRTYLSSFEEKIINVALKKIIYYLLFHHP